MLRIASGRSTKFLVIIAWLVILVAVGHNAVNLTKVQKSDPADFLPRKAEATRALEQAVRFPSGRLTAATVVYRRDSGLTAADRQRVRSDHFTLRNVTGVGAVDETLFSADHTSALVIARVSAKAPGVLRAVKDIRKLVTHGNGGLAVAVTGPAGFVVDSATVLGSIDTTLLLATVSLVLILLIAIYRSPTFWVLPLIAILFAVATSRGIAYLLGKHGVTITGEAGGIMTVLIFGVGTDYALLLVARYREELGRHQDAHTAVAQATRQAAGAIVPSALTVVAGLLCLLLANVRGTAGLGAIGAAGVVVAMLAMLTLLPALLAIVGRRAFWPFIPRPGAHTAKAGGGAWERIATWVAAKPRKVWLASMLGLAVMSVGLVDLNSSLTTENGFRSEVEALKGQRLVAEAFPAGVSAPAFVIVQDPARAGAVQSALRGAGSVTSLGAIENSAGAARFEAVTAHDPYGEPGFRDIASLRSAARGAGGPTTVVGGSTAQEQDLRSAQSRDNILIIPLVLVLVLLILGVLLRAVVAPVLLVGTVVASFAATLGLVSFVFTRVFHFHGMDPSLPLLGFILLVALGVDYNIFLMTRVRAETTSQGTRAGMIRGLAATGGVITSAGIVLAGTFSMLAVLPLVVLTEVGVTIALGALLDTFVVRSLLVPALGFEIGAATWWPSRLARQGKARTVPLP